MITMEIESRTPVSAAQVLQRLEEIEEPGRVQRDTVEHLRKHLAVQATDTFDEMREELEGLDSFRDDHIIKIIETLPRSEQEVNALFSKERVKLDDSEIQEVVKFAESVGTR